MIVFPNAKINLGLHIKGRRADGYHELETAFYPIPVCDALEMVPGEETRMHSSGLEVEGENLCMKAYGILAREFSLPALDMYLHKVIPMGAGLGGGSADAAFFLRGINEWAGLGLSESRLYSYARKLGADCVFFLENRPMLARGIGDELSPLEMDLHDFRIQVIYPGISISTARAYSQVQVKTPETSLIEVLKLPVRAWKGRLINDFEKSVFEAFPQLEEIKERLYAGGAVYAAMSGSGSALFGIFEKDKVLPQWGHPAFTVFNF